MRRKPAVLCLGFALACIIWSGARIGQSDDATTTARAGKQDPNERLKPVEGDAQQFMAHVMEPTFTRLKQSMAVRPSLDETWKGISSDSLILAESGNLLLMRTPGPGYEKWDTNATAIRTLGAQLYRSAKERDYQASLLYYRHLVDRCSACHREYAEGQHQLEP